MHTHKKIQKEHINEIMHWIRIVLQTWGPYFRSE